MPCGWDVTAVRSPRGRHPTWVEVIPLGIPVHAGTLALGTWQGIYVFEHRNRPHMRTLFVQLIGG